MVDETETAWRIEQVIDGESYVSYIRNERAAGEMMKHDTATVTAIGYEDPRSEWEKTLSATSLASEGMDTDIDVESAIEALNFEKIEEHYGDGTADELERVGENWDEASTEEQVAFILLYTKFDRMAKRAEELLDSEYWGAGL